MIIYEDKFVKDTAKYKREKLKELIEDKTIEFFVDKRQIIGKDMNIPEYEELFLRIRAPWK